MTAVTQAPAGPGRARILRAAGATFAERGYEGTSIAAIASRAGTAKSAIYHHFGSKAGLYEALLAAGTEDLVFGIAAAVPQPLGDVRTATRSVVDAYLEFVETRGDVWQLLVRDAPVDPALVEVYERFRRQRTEALLRLFPDVDPGDVGKGRYVELLTVALRAFATWWHDNRDVPRAQVVDAVMDFAAAAADRLAR